MYKVMLVDDESLILRGLTSLIEWEKLGLKVFETAKNGKEAFDKFLLNPVDVVITDINMPLISGLELIEKIAAINKNTKFIILSGYEDFSYAKCAIKNGVFNYILKPIDEDELINTLLDIVKLLKKSENEQNNHIIKNNIIKNFVTEKIDFNTFENSLNEFEFFDKYKYFSVSTIILESKEFNINIKELIYNKPFYFFYDDFSNIILINFWEVYDENLVLKYFQNILKKCKINCFIAVGKIVSKYEDLPKSYNNSVSKKKYILKYGFNNVIMKCDIENSVNISFGTQISELNRLIIEKNLQQIKMFLLRNININSFSSKYIYDLSIDILILIDNIKKYYKIEEDYYLGNEINNLINLFTTASIIDFLFEKITFLIKSIDKEQIKYSPIIKRVIECVERRYFEDLNLKMLGSEYNINSSYLGQVFSKEVGCSFSEYLNKIRNNIAKNLVLNSNKKITDIAKEVGYVDTSYFYKKFKKYYGITPSALRELKKY